jgi:(aminoalkyl)phosphonate N-acetyltransferase
MFRKATKEDVKDIYRLMCILEETTFDEVELSKIFYIQNQDNQYYALVYEQDNAVKGILNMRFEFQLHHCAKIAEILEFVIDEDCRNKGIGKQMLEQAISIAKEQGCDQIELDSNQKRKNAHRFYEREGFTNTHYKFVKSI